MSSTLPSARAEAVTRRTYNRPLDDSGTILETWAQTVHRATRVHHKRLWEGANGKVDDAELDELFNLVHDRKALVSGRTLWLGGTDYSASRACSQFNCAYTRSQTVYEFVDIFWLLLNGCGVGGRPISGTLHGFLKPISNLEIIESNQPPEHRGDPHNTCQPPTAENGYHWRIKIGDSAEAWAKSLGKMLNPPTCAVKKLTIDFSDVRGPGKRLKGYGWICNGSAPLQRAYTAIFEIMNSKAGDLLDEIDLLNIINWLGTVLSSRRSAQILLMDYDHPRWEQFARAKNNWWICNQCGEQNTHSKYICPTCGGRTNAHRQQSNNSIVFWHKPTKREIKDIMQMIWDNGGSEPGFINGVSARNRAPWFDGLNPCGEILLQSRGFCVSADTLLQHRNGADCIADLVGTTVDVWNGETWSNVTPRVTGHERQLVRVRFSDGSYLDCTPSHRFSVFTDFNREPREVMASDLLSLPGRRVYLDRTTVSHPGGVHSFNAYTFGVCLGDVSLSHRESGSPFLELDLYGVKMHLPVLGTKGEIVRKAGYNVDSVPVYGLDDVVDYETLVEYRTNPDALLNVFRWNRSSTLAFIAGWLDTDGSETGTGGVRLYVTGYRRAQLVQMLLTRCGIRSSINLHAEAGTKTNFAVRNADSWYVQITECQDIPCHRLDTSRGHAPVTKGRYQVVRAVEPLPGFHTTYCFDEPIRHMGLFGNVLTYQCNLVTTAVNKFKNNFAALLRALYIMGRANYRQTCVELSDGVLMPEWNQTNAALRLCGMSLTGISQATWLTDYQIKMMRNAAIEGTYSMAAELGLPKPKLVTTIKPEGTGSKIMDVTEGIHKPLGRFIFNWIIFPAADPMVGMLAEAGYRVIDHPQDSLSKLVCFPIDYSGCRFDMHGKKHVNLDTAIDQLDTYRRWNTLWTDHNSSITISWNISEIDDIVEWLNRYWNDFVAVSWCTRNDPTKTAKDLGYAYLPQEVVEESTYGEYASTLQSVDWSRLHGIHDLTLTDCVGGMCPVK